MLGPEEKVIELTEFDGIWARGNPDEVPATHAVDCLNMKLDSKGKCITRAGTSSAITLKANLKVFRWFQSGIRPAPISSTTASAINTLVLDNANNLYKNNDSSPLFSLGGMVDFAAINAFNRTFISPNAGRLGFKASRLKIFYSYNGTWICRDAAGPAPRETTAAFAAANSSNAGNVPAGVHNIAVIYQTDTGFATSPGPKVDLPGSTYTYATAAGNPTTISFIGVLPNLVTGDSIEITGCTGAWTPLNDFWFITKITNNEISVPLDSTAFGAFAGAITIHGEFAPAIVTADGTHTISLTNVPTGPSYVVQRIILATQAGGSEYFYVPNGIIYDNSTTSFEIDFYDTDLVISADSLFDLMEVIPSGTGLCQYNGRIVITGAFFFFNTALISNVSDPESFSTVTGFSEVLTENDGNDLVACFVLRDILYLSRFIGFFSSQDNGGDPSTWPVNIIDAFVGTNSNGLCTFTTTIAGSTDSGDIILLASREGIYIFDGVVRRPELTFKIQDIWLTMPIANGFGGFNQVQVRQSLWTHQLFITITDSSGYPAYVMAGDYDPLEGIIDPLAIRWSRFVFPYHPTAILTSDNLYYATKDVNPGVIVKIDPSQTLDYDGSTGTIIDNFYQTYFATCMFGWVIFFKAVRLRGISSGVIQLTLVGLDGTTTALPPTFTAAPGQEYLRLVNFVSEKMSVRVEVNTLNQTLNINRMEIMAIARWQVRPT